jgi:hypothetical protein
MYEHFDTPRAPLQFAPECSTPPGPSRYEIALDDLAGNDGTMVVRSVYELAEKVENDFDGDATLTVEGFQAAKERFEALVEKAYEAFDAYEAKLEAIEEVFNARR